MLLLTSGMVPFGLFMLFLIYTEGKAGGWSYIVRASLVLLAAVTILLAIGILSIAAGTRPVLTFFPEGSMPYLLAWTGACLAGTLFVLRNRHKATYGIVEVAVGLATLIL